VRPGTVDAVLAAGFEVAAQHARSSPARYGAVAELRDVLERGLVAAGARVNGAATRAPHVTNVALAGWNAPELVAALDLEGICASGGSACSAGTSEPSPVLAAMFGADPRATSSVRFSLGETTTKGDVKAAVHAFASLASRR
jgi:cysteine desulfurase